MSKETSELKKLDKPSKQNKSQRQEKAPKQEKPKKEEKAPKQEKPKKEEKAPKQGKPQKEDKPTKEEKRERKAGAKAENETRKREKQQVKRERKEADEAEKRRRRAEAEEELRRREMKSANQIRYSRGEEWFNRISHLVGAALFGLGCAALIVKTCFAYESVGALGIVSVSLFSFSVLLLYIMSTLYHWRPVGKRSRAVFRRFDHCSIALLIAGTYAPFMLVGMYSGGGSAKIWAIVLAAVVLAFAVLSCVFNAIDVNKFKVFSLISYVVMGWACVIRIDLLIRTIAWQAFALLLGGGVVYTVGIIFYRKKSIPFNHAIWHLFVMGGTLLHFLAIYLYIIP